MASDRNLDRRTPLIAAAANILPSMLVATLGISLPEVRQTFSLSAVAGGALFSTIFVCAALSSAVAGRLSDRIGRKAVLLMGLSSLAAGFALSGLAPGYAPMLVCLAVSGMGYGFTTPSLYALMSDLLPHRRGLGASLVSVAYGIGGSLGALASSMIIARTGWRAAFLAVSLVGALLAALEAISVRERGGPRSGGPPLSYARSLTGGLMLLALAEFFGGSVFWSSASWTATVLRTAKELTLAETGWVMGIWGLTPMIGALLLGPLSDRFGRKRVILWSAYPGALAAFAVYYWLASPVSLALGLFVFGTLKASVPILVVALAQESSSGELAGTASGVVMSMHYVAAFTAPLVAGRLIAQTGDMVLAMILTSVLPLLVYAGLISAVREKARS